MFAAGIVIVIAAIAIIVSWFFVGLGAQDEVPVAVVMGVIIGLLGIVGIVYVTGYLATGGAW